MNQRCKVGSALDKGGVGMVGAALASLPDGGNSHRFIADNTLAIASRKRWVVLEYTNGI